MPKKLQNESAKAGAAHANRGKIIRVLVADDHAMVRHGLRLLLEEHHDIRVIGEAGNGREAVRFAREHQPDVVIMDIAMPVLNGIEAAARVREVSPRTGVVMISMYTTSEFLFRAQKAGVHAYVPKRCEGGELVRAVRAAHARQRYISPAVREKLIEEYVRQDSTRAGGSPIERLSRREREVLQLVVEGQSSAMIARTLSLSKPSVQTYRSRIMQKLNIHDLPGLIRFAIAHGLTTVD